MLSVLLTTMDGVNGHEEGRGLRAARILVVEDAKDIREVFQVLLEAEGAHVVATGSGREAADLAAQSQFDMLLTDLGLPDIPGDVLIRRILESVAPRPRVVVVTGFGEPHITRAREAGADVVLTKPVEWTAVLNHLTASPCDTAPGAVAA